MRIRPTADRVLVRPDIDTRAPASHGALLVAPSLAAAVAGQDRRVSRISGVIVALGPDANRVPLLTLHRRNVHVTTEDPVRVGDRVVFGSERGHEIACEGEAYVILRQADILAIMEG